jgi:CysZ protein
MLLALFRACNDLFAPSLRRIVGLSLGLTVASFVALWIAVALALDHTALFGFRPLQWLVDLLGTLAVMALSWLLFPAVATMVTGFFLDRIATAVEALNCPGSAPPRHGAITETMAATLRLMGLTIVGNLLALPLYVLAPGINFFVFLGLNGYLLGREYFEVVALRRLDPTAARALRRRFQGRVFFAGAIVSGLFAVPLVNLVTPVIATAFMLHLFERLRRTEPQLAAS